MLFWKKKREIAVLNKQYSPDEYFRKADWHWSYTVIITGIFVGLFSIFFLGQKMVMGWENILKWYLLMALTPLLVPYKWQRPWYKMERLELILFYTLGTGPLTLSLLFGVNYMFVTETQKLSLKVDHVTVLANSISPGEVRMEFSSKHFQSLPKLRTFDQYELGYSVLDTDSVEYVIGTGLLGVDVVKEVKFIDD